MKLTISSSQTLLLSASLGQRPSCYLSETCGETLEEEDGPAPKNINLDHTELDGPHKCKSFCQEVTSNVGSGYITTNISYTELAYTDREGKLYIFAKERARSTWIVVSIQHEQIAAYLPSRLETNRKLRSHIDPKSIYDILNLLAQLHCT
ncbi:Hypothetical predicted protein [Paramuricea clavata]|uniref:Uncharacterized protein n=1 Tax=Paramuricea clavata TaxID=317549 RepID=A0A7D9DVV9_PARCT|nr:Hypothetical predicted protein [Paramuricea clavata]